MDLVLVNLTGFGMPCFHFPLYLRHLHLFFWPPHWSFEKMLHCRESETWEHSVLTGFDVIKPSHKAQGLCRRGGRKTVRGDGWLQGSGVSEIPQDGGTSERTDTVLACIGPVQFKLGGCQLWDGEETWGSAPNQEAIWNWCQLAKGESVSSNGGSPGSWVTKSKPPGFVCFFVLWSFVSFWLFGEFLLLSYWFFICLKREKNHELGWVGGWGGSGRSWERANMIKIECIQLEINYKESVLHFPVVI